MASLIEETRFEHKGYECIIRKTGYEIGSTEAILLSSWSDNFQWYCGYVVVPNDHRLFGVHYDKEPMWNISVHGGLTYSRQEDDKWVIGFDCNHYEDNIENQTYDYVKNECISLVEQLIKLEKSDE